LARGDVWYYPAQIITGEAGTGGVTKGDVCKITGLSGKKPTFTRVSATTDVPCAIALKDADAGEDAPFLLLGMVVELSATATVTQGAWVTILADGTVQDAPTSALTTGVRTIPLVGVAWDGITTGTAVLPIQVMWSWQVDSGLA